MLMLRKLFVGATVCGLFALVASCGGGGGGSDGGGSGGSGGGSSSLASVSAYVPGNEIEVVRAFDFETVKTVGLTNGNYVVVWNGSDMEDAVKNTDRSGVFYRIYNPSGAAVTPVRIANSLTDNNQWQPSVAALTGGGFVITWNHGRAIGDVANGDTIHAQRFDNGGNKQGSQTQISSHRDGSSASQVIGLSGGGYVVSWRDFIMAGGSGGVARQQIKVRLYTSSGSAVTSITQIDETSSESPTVERGALIPHAGGGFIYMKSTNQSRPGSSTYPHITAQVYSSSGAATGTGYYVNAPEIGAYGPTAIPLYGGGYVAVWPRSIDSQYTYRRVDGADNYVGDAAIYPFDMPGVYSGQLAPLKAGGFVSVNQGSNEVYAQVFNPDLTPFGSPLMPLSGGNGPIGVSVGSGDGGGFAVTWYRFPENPKVLKLRIYSPR